MDAQPLQKRERERSEEGERERERQRERKKLGSYCGFCIGTGDGFVLQNSHYRSSAAEQKLGSNRLQYSMTKWEPPPPLCCYEMQILTASHRHRVLWLFLCRGCRFISIHRRPFLKSRRGADKILCRLANAGPKGVSLHISRGSGREA